jgi:protein TonB
MERPSHTIRALSFQSGSRRFAGAGLAVMAQLALAAAFVGGVVVRTGIMPPPDIKVAHVKDVEARTPPPPVRIERPAMPTAVEPDFVIAQEPSGPTITTVPPRPDVVAPVARQSAPPVATVSDHAAIANPQTHTAPPYPTMARRLGAQGKVTLRLTVLADGRVDKAEVVTSSGRQDLDQAAAEWVTGHWTYRPAVRDGAPAASQVMAAIQFNLNDAQ